jgi:HD-GYP domain-containing protein (c-di-GMP phosphodiesterase class II)
MKLTVRPYIHPTVLRIQSLLAKIDRLSLPAASRRDVATILVRQAGSEIDRALPWQAGHGRRTATIAAQLGQAASLTADELHDVKLAALLHDIGLLMIPAHLTNTAGPLDGNAYVAVQNHSRLGANLLEPFSFLRTASVFIAHHHERWDGTGYPYSIRGEFIPLGARILSIADAFDAIRVPHVPCRRRRDTIALRILRVASGTQFDPALVLLLSRIMNPEDSFDTQDAQSRRPLFPVRSD